MPFIGDPAVASRQLKNFFMFGEGIIEIGMRIQGAKVATQCDMCLDVEKLLREEKHQMLVQKRLNCNDLFAIQIDQGQALNFRTQTPGQAGN
jgi:hypothetical protein